ncbi:hypothetical protein BH10PLA1_BH10PLA1_20970 [soil metagenome]
MVPLFLGLTAFNLLCLITTTCMGYALSGHGHAGSLHLLLGVMTTMACIGVHCIVFTYFIATAKWVQHAVSVKSLPIEWIAPTRSFKMQAFPPALIAMAAVFLVAILGAAADNYAVSARWHFAAAIAAIIINAIVAQREYVAIVRNGKLIDELLIQINGPANAST